MKTKTYIIAGILLVCLAIVLGILIVTKNDDDTRNSDMRNAAYNPAVDTSPRNRSTGPRRPVSTPLSNTLNDKQALALIDSVMLIQDPAQRLEAIRKRLGMDISDALYQKALAAYGYQNSPNHLFWIIANLWMYDEPAAATAWWHRFPIDGWGKHHISGPLAQWMHVDRVRAMAWAKEQGIDPEVIERADANSAANNEKWRPKQPGEKAAELGEKTAELKLLHQRLLALAQDPSSDLVERDDLSSRMHFVFSTLVSADPAAAIEFVNTTMADSPDRDRFYHNGLVELSKFDPDQALFLAKEMQDKKRRYSALLEILPAWQLKYPDRNIAEVVDVDNDLLLDHYILNSTLLENLALRNPSHALKYAMELESPSLSSQAVSRVIESWATVSPTEACKAAAEMPPGDMRESTLVSLAEEIAASDFQQAILVIDQITWKDGKELAIHNVLHESGIIYNSFQDAIGLLDQLPTIESFRTQQWIGSLRRIENAPAIRAWLKQAYDSGQIVLRPGAIQRHTDAGNTDPYKAEYQQTLDELDQRVKELDRQEKQMQIRNEAGYTVPIKEPSEEAYQQIRELRLKELLDRQEKLKLNPE